MIETPSTEHALRTRIRELESACRDTDRLRKDWVAMRDRAEKAEAAVERVRSLHDQLDSETGLAYPDQEITRGSAARKIAGALDGYTPPVAPVELTPVTELYDRWVKQGAPPLGVSINRWVDKRLIELHQAIQAVLGSRRSSESAQCPGCGCPQHFGFCNDCGCLDNRLPEEKAFGAPGCTCKPWTTEADGKRRFLEPGESIERISGWQVFRGCPHHAGPTSKRRA